MTTLAVRSTGALRHRGSPPPSRTAPGRSPPFWPGLQRPPLPRLRRAGRRGAGVRLRRCFGPLEATYDLAGPRAAPAPRRRSTRASPRCGASRSSCPCPTLPAGGLRVRLVAARARRPGWPHASASSALGQGRFAQPHALVQGPRRGRGRRTRRRVGLPHAGLRLDRQPLGRRGRGRGRAGPAGGRLHPGRPGARQGGPGARARRAPSCASRDPTTRSTGSAWSSPTSWRAGPS